VPVRDALHTSLATALSQQWPSYAAYVTSFLVIGIIWVNHHAVFELIGEKHVLLIPAADLDCAVPFSYYASGNYSGSQYDTFRSQVNVTTFDPSRFPNPQGLGNRLGSNVNTRYPFM